MMAEALGRWVREEMELPPSAVPSPATLRRLCSGPTAPIWDFVTRHVRSQRNVKKIRGNLRWYGHLQQMESAAGGPPSRQGALRAELSRLRQELRALGDAVGSAQDTAQRLEAALGAGQSRRWAELRRGAELRLLGAGPSPEYLRGHQGALKGPRKRPGQSRAELSAILASGAEPEVLVSIKALCKAREAELARPRPPRKPQKDPPPAQDWREQAEAVLIGYSPEAVLWALEALANQSTRELLLGPAPSPEAPPTLRSLIQGCWGALGGLWGALPPLLAHLTHLRRRLEELRPHLGREGPHSLLLSRAFLGAFLGSLRGELRGDPPKTPKSPKSAPKKPKSPKSAPKSPNVAPNLAPKPPNLAPKSAPNLDPKSPNLAPKSPNLDQKIPNLDPNLDPKSSNLASKIPNLDLKSPNSAPKIPNSAPKIPNLDLKIPNLDPKIPNLAPNLAPNLDPKLPNLDPKLPNLDPKSPNSDQKIPNLDLKIPNLDLKSPNLAPKIPNLAPDSAPNLPNLDLKIPNLAPNLPNSAPKSPNLDLKIPNLDPKLTPNLDPKSPNSDQKIPNLAPNLAPKPPNLAPKLTPDLAPKIPNLAPNSAPKIPNSAPKSPNSAPKIPNLAPNSAPNLPNLAPNLPNSTPKLPKSPNLAPKIPNLPSLAPPSPRQRLRRLQRRLRRARDRVLQGQQRLRFLSAATRGRRAGLRPLQEQVVGVARAGLGSAPPSLWGEGRRRAGLVLGALGALGAPLPRPAPPPLPEGAGPAQQGALLPWAAALRRQLHQGALSLRRGAGLARGAEPEPAPPLPAVPGGVAELLPGLRLVRECCQQRIRAWPRLQALVSQWWDQPAQFALATPPGHAPFSHWLQRWRDAARALQATPTPALATPTEGEGEGRGEEAPPL